MGRVKSDNEHLAILSGIGSRWQHVTGNATITPRAGESVVLNRIIVGTTSASAIILRDSAVGVIATLKASIAEGNYTFGIKCRGNLIIENPGGSDLTVVFSND